MKFSELTTWQDLIAPKLIPHNLSGAHMIACDFHAPITSLKWVKRLVEVGKELGIKRLVIGGDLFDLKILSWWVKQSGSEQATHTAEAELAFTENILSILESHYCEFVMLGGNHWLRIVNALKHSIKNQRLLGLVNRGNDSRYKFIEVFDYLLIDNKVRVTHPLKGRKADLTLARDIAIKFPDQWMVLAHRHRASMGASPSGQPMIETGGMVDPEREPYVQTTDSGYYMWTNGFVAYQGDTLQLYTEYNRKWRTK